jgi:hypothetical protein
VLFALVEQPSWTRGEDLTAEVRISPWRFIGAINRLTLAKKVRVSISSSGGRMYVISERGRDFILPKGCFPAPLPE